MNLHRTIRSARTTGVNLFNAVKAQAGKAVVGAGSLVAAGTAFAGDTATAFTTEIAPAKAEMILIAVACMGLVGVLILITYGRRAAK